MNHRKSGRGFGRRSDERRALMRSLARALVAHETIKTTLPKAKELRGFVEPLITLAARGDLAARRRLIAKLRDKDTVVKLMDDLGPHFKLRPGGYLRLVKCGFRAGDAAPMSWVQLVDREGANETA